MLPRISKFVVLMFCLIGLLIGWSVWKITASKTDTTIAFPLIDGSETCVTSELNKIGWLKRDSYSIEKFSHVPLSYPSITGLVEIKLKQGNARLIEAVVNSLFHNCYPENLSVWNLSEPKDDSLKNALSITLRESAGNAKKIYIEIDLDKNQMRTTSR